MTQRILISTGGSGGHVVPATILYEHLRDQFYVCMSIDNRGMKFLNKNKYNLKVFNITPIWTKAWKIIKHIVPVKTSLIFSLFSKYIFWKTL